MLAPRLAEFIRFCLVGGLAFIVDAGLLELLVAAGLPAGAARAISIAVALQCSFFMHGAFTYRAHRGFCVKSWQRFMLSNLLGAAINYGIFVALLQAALGNTPQTDRLLALVAGTTVALFFNHWANRRFAFARKAPDA